MFDALYIGATGLQAQQLNVDTIANNVANATTIGFKKARVSFTDLMAREAVRQTLPAADADLSILGGELRTGIGVGVASMAKVFETGDIQKTDSALDIAISGDGFLEVTLPDGSRAYTRGGTLKVNRDGLLATQAGHPLKPTISIPDSVNSIVIRADGVIQGQVTGQSNLIELGQLDLVRFANPSGLLASGDGLYRASEASGEAITSKAGEDNVGNVMQGYLEGSNVHMVDEMVNLMVAQRAYEANAKVLQASDEMLGMVNSLRR